MSHPLDKLMETTMESLKGMVDVNTIIADPVETPNGTVIIPISRVSFGFAAGGGNYTNGGSSDNKNENKNSSPSFAGGSGAGITIKPVAFLVVGQGQGEVRLLPVSKNAMFDRVLDLAPEVIDELKTLINR